jgi:hypothetical protein
MLAALTQTPELALGDDESRKLAEALANVTRHMSLPALSPEKMALGMLFWTAGSIYVPRVMAISARKRGAVPGFAQEGPPAAQEGPPPINPAAPVGSWFMPDAATIQ